MSAMQRNKGSAGEREVAAILRAWLGVRVTRNWQGSAAEGGSDLSGIDGWAVEVKRTKIPAFRAWWEQTLAQAEGRKPILIYRLDGQDRGLPETYKWHCMVRLADICRVEVDPTFVAEIPLAAWIDILREEMQP